MEKSLNQFGAVSGSTTFPGQCVVHLVDSSSVYTETHLMLTTYDVSGRRRNSGGDPVKAEIIKVENEGQQQGSGESSADKETIGATVKDNEDGTYSVCFR